MERDKLVKYLDDLLKISEIEDVCCNGLQVEWKAKITKIGLAVDACMATFEQAKEKGCQILLTHHWMIWWWLTSITWVNYKKVKFLVESWINLYCAHLPLDMHKQYWNNICLSKLLDLKNIKDFWKYQWMSIWFKWELKKALTCEEIASIFEPITWREPSLLSFWKEKNKTVWIVSWGGSYKKVIQAKQEWLDCYITWEWSHESYHIALEEWLNIIYLGHYHSEKIWVIALWAHIEKKFWIKVEFLDEPSVF